MERIRVGIIGTGRIAQRMYDTIKSDERTQVTCVFNPHITSANAFAEKNGIPNATESLDELWNHIDACYIASPHDSHSYYAKAALLADKHVICEKPLALSKVEVEDLYTLADFRNKVLLEAIKTAYCPGFIAMMDMAKSGKIGKIIDVEACFTRLTPTNVRECTDAMFGGSFTEFGSYVLLPIMKLMGTDYHDLSFQSVKLGNGVDSYTKATISYENGMALAKTGLLVKSEGQLIISGTNGYIIAPSPWWLTKKFQVRYEDPNRIETYEYPYAGSGLQYEFNEFINRITTGRVAAGVTKEESIAMSSVMDEFLKRRSTDNDEFIKKRNNVKIWAHRGCSMKYPENTLLAFEKAAQIKGLAGIELDVQLTKDGHVVVIHDENVTRVSDGNKSVSDYTLEELKSLKISSTGLTESGYTDIPTFREVLELLKPYCINNGLMINIELKTSVVRYDGIEKKTYDLVNEYGLSEYVVYSSFLPDSIKKIKEIDRSCKTGMLCGSLVRCIDLAKECKADALHPCINSLDCVVPSSMKDMPVRAYNGIEHLYGGDRLQSAKDLREFADFGVTDIFTNAPELYL